MVRFSPRFLLMVAGWSVFLLGIYSIYSTGAVSSLSNNANNSSGQCLSPWHLSWRTPPTPAPSSFPGTLLLTGTLSSAPSLPGALLPPLTGTWCKDGASRGVTPPLQGLLARITQVRGPMPHYTDWWLASLISDDRSFQSKLSEVRSAPTGRSCPLLSFYPAIWLKIVPKLTLKQFASLIQHYAGFIMKWEPSVVIHSDDKWHYLSKPLLG